MIVIGYQGIGKSTISKFMRGVVDLESSNFYVDGKRHDDWYKVYANIALDLSRQSTTVLTPSHAVLRERLHEMNSTGENIAVCYPSLDLKSEWIDRLEKRYADDPCDKNLRALMNAKDRYTENIREIIADADRFGFIKMDIDSMDYSMQKIIWKLYDMTYSWEKNHGIEPKKS